jgi:hypothetical protein
MPAWALVKQIDFDEPDASATIETPLKIGDGVAVSGFVEGALGREQFFHDINFTLESGADISFAATWFQLPPFGNTLGYELTGPQGLEGSNLPSLVEMETTTGQITTSFANLSSGDYSLLIGGLFMADIATYDARIAITPIPGAAVLLGTAVAGLGLFARRRLGTP